MRVQIRPDRVDAAMEAVDFALPLGGLRQHRQRFDFLEQDPDGFLELEQVWWHPNPCVIRDLRFVMDASTMQIRNHEPRVYTSMMRALCDRPGHNRFMIHDS